MDLSQKICLVQERDKLGALGPFWVVCNMFLMSEMLLDCPIMFAMLLALFYALLLILVFKSTWCIQWLLLYILYYNVGHFTSTSWYNGSPYIFHIIMLGTSLQQVEQFSFFLERLHLCATFVYNKRCLHFQVAESLAPISPLHALTFNYLCRF